MTAYARNDAWLTTQAEGELLMMHVDSGAFQGLNQTGLFLWNMMSEPRDRTAMLEGLRAEFDVSEERARADIDAFLSEMVAHGMLRASGGA